MKIRGRRCRAITGLGTRVSLLCFLTLMACAQTRTQTGGSEAANLEIRKSGARIQFGTNTLHLGRLAGGTVVRCTFRFTNTGPETLEITGVEPSCGCITAGNWSRRVAPGDSGAIPLEINAPNIDSMFSKTVVIKCNDPTEPQQTLKLSGTLWRAVEITPPVVSFDFSNDTEANPVKTVRVISKLLQPLQLSLLSIERTNFQAEVSTIEPGKEFEVSIRCSSIPRQGPMSFCVKLRTSCSELPVLGLNVVALVPPPVEIKPPRIVLMGTSQRELAVTIRNHLDVPLKLSAPEISIPGAQVKLEEKRPGQEFRVVLTVPAGFRLASWQHGKVTIGTGISEPATLEIPIIAL